MRACDRPGAIPTHTQPAERKVNSQTDLLLVGTAAGQDEADAAAVGQALRALRHVNSKRGGAKAKPPCRRLDEVQLASLLSAGAEGEGTLAWGLEQLVAALELARQRHVLLTLALESAAWRAAEEAAPLQGLSVCMTGVMCCAMGSDDTHAVLGCLVRRCGGEVVASVTKGGTSLLIVGRGEKGENGRPDGKGGRAGSKRQSLSLNGRSTAPARPASLKGQGARCSPQSRAWVAQSP